MNETKQFTHVDTWVDSAGYGGSKEEDYAKFFLFLHRLPATLKLAWSIPISRHQLYCTFEGKTYRVIGASRLGDIWLTSDLTRTEGYEKRVFVDSCSDWRSAP